jgi:MscS family membrane protein
MDFLEILNITSNYNKLVSVVTDFIQQQNWLAIFVVLLATLLFERVVSFLFKRIVKFTRKTKTDLDDKVIQQILRPVCNYILLFGLFIIIYVLKLPKSPLDINAVLITSLKIAFMLNTIFLLLRLTNVLGDYIFSKVLRTSSRLDDQLVPIFVKTVKIFLFILAAIYIIQALGYSISGVIAGLGIGGLAVAMAAKDTLANLFGSIMLISDRPFRVGDWIKVGDDEGIVEQIGFRSTRIRTFAKTLISVPNSQIANDSINNFSKMPKRRVKLTVGVTYDTTADQMETLIRKLREFLENHEEVDQDFFLVDFTDFGASSLDILVYYFTKTIKWAKHMQLRQDINLSIMRIIEGMGLSIAFPTRTVHVKTDDNYQNLKNSNRGTE